MESSALTVLYKTQECSVVILPGASEPSLALSPEVASQLCELLNSAHRGAKSLPPSPKTLPIHELCSRLEHIFASFGRGLIEWQATLPLEPEAKFAVVELLSAVRKLEELQGNHAPHNT